MAKKIPINYCPQKGTKDFDALLKEIKSLIWGQQTEEGKLKLESLGLKVVPISEVCKYAGIEKYDNAKLNITQSQFDKAINKMVDEGVSLYEEQDASQMDILSFYPFKEKAMQDGNTVEVEPTYPTTYDENGNEIDVSSHPELIQEYQDAYTRQLGILQQTVKTQGVSCIKNLPPRVAVSQKELIIKILRDAQEERVIEAKTSIENIESKRQEVVTSFNEAKLKYDELKHTPNSQLTSEGQAQRDAFLKDYREKMENAKGELDKLYAAHKQNNKTLKETLKEQKGLEGEISSAFGKKAIKSAEKSIEKNTNERMTFGQHINKWVQNQKDRNLRFKAEVRNEAIATGRPVVSAALNVFVHNPPLPIIGEPIQKLSDFFKNKEGEDKKETGIISKAKNAFSKITERISEKFAPKSDETEDEEVILIDDSVDDSVEEGYTATVEQNTATVKQNTATVEQSTNDDLELLWTFPRVDKSEGAEDAATPQENS